MARAGVEYTVGREGREDFGESLAGFLPAPLRPRTLEHISAPAIDISALQKRLLQTKQVLSLEN